MGVTLEAFFSKIMLGHIKNGIGVPFSIAGNADSSYMADIESEAHVNDWSLMKLAQKLEFEWVEFCNSMAHPVIGVKKITSGNPVITYEPNPATVFSGGEYEVDWDEQVSVTDSAVAAHWVQYDPKPSLSAVSVGDFWYDQNEFPYLIAEVDSGGGRVLVQGISNTVDGSGGKIKSGNGGIDQGKISEAFHGGNSGGMEQDFDLSSSDGTFVFEEVVENGSNVTGVLLDSDGLTKGYFKKQPSFPGAVWPALYNVELVDASFLSTGDLIYFKDGIQTLASQIVQKSSNWIGVEEDIYGSPPPYKFSRDTPSWVELQSPSDLATYVILELDDPTQLFATGDTITGATSGTTATLGTDNTDYETASENKDVKTALLDILKANTPKSKVTLSPSPLVEPLLPIIVV
ncbi:MAG: hypothetical protein ACTSPI_00205 [Candidatus Heimdallarchaeaceae archaeon]